MLKLGVVTRAHDDAREAPSDEDVTHAAVAILERVASPARTRYFCPHGVNLANQCTACEIERMLEKEERAG